MLPFGRWRIYLTQENGWTIYGLDGWGWVTWTLRGAHRKGARELRRKVARDWRLEARQKTLEATR